MPCYKPLKGWRGRKKTKNGKFKIVFNIKEAWNDEHVNVPCGQCIGCRLERSRQWAMRCMHESSLYSENCFITLTYNNEHLPENGALVKKDFQKFMKRLRKKYDHKIRFFHCGEYGDMHGRPHYHAILFNHDFKDKEYHSVNKQGDIVWRSEELETLWDKGYSTVGECTFETCAYVARYITKKQTGENALLKYCVIDPATGEIMREIPPEYTTMSRGGRTEGKNLGGIGKQWFDLYMDDIYPKDFVTFKGKIMQPPKYYDGLYELEDPKEMAEIKGKRNARRRLHEKDNTDERLEARERIKETQNKMLIRSLDNVC